MSWIIEFSGASGCGRVEVHGGIEALFARLENLAGYTVRWRRKRV